MRFKLFAIGLLLLLAPGSQAHQNHPERSLNDDTGEKQLFAPVFTQSDPLASYLSITEVSGRYVGVTVQEYRENGRESYRESHLIARDSLSVHNTHHSLTDPITDNGWAKITFPDFAEVYAVNTTWDRKRPGLYVESQVVEPANAFRLFARLTEEGETGIAIVNPTDAAQSVTVTFYEHGPESGRVSNRTWEIEAQSKLSRFLRELVPLGGDPPPSTISAEPIRFNGVVRVQGQTVIAVGALWFSRETEWFSSVIVTTERLD